METLQEIGLSKTESKVYLALLELGSALAGKITKLSGINRTNVYDALERLIEKGLVSYVISANRKVFESVNPEKLQEILKEKQDKLNSLMPELQLKYKSTKSKAEATIFKGKKGLKSIADDVLKTKKPMLAFGAEGKFVQLFPYYSKHWHKKRSELKIPIKIIYNEKIRKTKSKQKFPQPMEMRFNKTLYDTPATTWIYDDKVVVVVWSEQPIATLIRSKEVANSYKQFFNILWKDSKK